MHYLENLRELREAVGLTQREVAEACGVPTMRVSRWESGESAVSLAHLAKLSELYDAQVYVNFD